MNKEYLPFYNSLNEKEKTFWLDCTKEALIDHLIANINNGEKLLKRIDKALKMVSNQKYLYIERLEKIKDILGDKENE